ncbi:hypothetical protein SKAU_G00145060 [Synaphobranchus kaupii]|uniref:Secreted protein n=1 Tax=Synaphobranchus kaupii TaxID=118154 RepID=A0A9Q1J4S7_SYNKA|nr:hypothetical protein SKAU_G00145060 [Synaphobranchus kaupii]
MWVWCACFLLSVRTGGIRDDCGSQRLAQTPTRRSRESRGRWNGYVPPPPGVSSHLSPDFGSFAPWKDSVKMRYSIQRLLGGSAKCAQPQELAQPSGRDTACSCLSLAVGRWEAFPCQEARPTADASLSITPPPLLNCQSEKEDGPLPGHAVTKARLTDEAKMDDSRGNG